MKIIAIGDLHGRNIWKDIINKTDYDKVIFIGDYFDSDEGISAEQQAENFKDVIAFKKDNPEKVKLLFGNHDFHYLPSVTEHYSGFQPAHRKDFEVLIKDAVDEDFLQACFVFENILFTHAGLTKTWSSAYDIDTKNPEQQLNDLLKHQPEAFRFAPGKNHSAIGDDITQSPIWVRPESLQQDKVDYFTQVVGHTSEKNNFRGWNCFD